MSTFDATDIDRETAGGETELYLTDDECSDIGFMDGYFARPDDPVGGCPVQRQMYAAGYARGRSQRAADLTPTLSANR